MPKLTEQELDRLDDFLCRIDNDEALLLSGLDGLLAGVVVCPELVLPGEWFPAIWGEEGPGFADVNEANEIFGLIQARYNEVVESLCYEGVYEPLLELDNDDSVLWEIWAEGFGAAVALRPECWDVYASSDNEEVRTAFECLLSLAGLALPEAEQLPESNAAELRQGAANLIAECLETLNATRLALDPQPVKEAVAGMPRVGRNDPCPCGSGKKFKKCCMN